MAEFQRLRGATVERWSILRSGAEVLIEASGQAATRESLPSEELAQKRLVELIRAQLDQGFEPISRAETDDDDDDDDTLPPDAGIRREAFEQGQQACEARIAADPEAVEGYQVYADWLLEQGDPWGELIALQVAKKTNDANRVLDRLAGRLFGPLVEAVRFQDLRITWRYGFIRTAQVIERPDSNSNAASMVSELLASRLSRFLRELRIGNGATQACLTALAASPRAAGLVTLRAGTESGAHLSLRGVGSALCSLEELELRGLGVELSEAPPKLQTLILATQSFDELLDDWRSTSLRELRLAMQVNGALFEVFCARTPNLETLVLEKPTGGTLDALCESRLLGALKVLRITAAKVATLRDVRARAEALKVVPRIELSSAPRVAPFIAELRQLLPNVAE